MLAKRRLGASGLEITPLVLGGNVFGWTADEAASFAILDRFVDAGGTMIDTADVYSAWVPGHSGGESESVIGRWIRASGKHHQVQIATKVGFSEGLAPDTVRTACDASLRRLGIDRIDLYYQHTDDRKVPLEASLGVFDELRRAGKIGEIGLSQYSAERLTEALSVADANGYTRPCTLQTWYNLVERDKLEGPLLDAATDGGIAILAFYALANGFLTGKYRSRNDLGKSVRGLRNVDYLHGRGLRVLQALDEVAAETGAALATVALGWTIAQPGITAPVASATNLDQLGELLEAMTLELTPAQIEHLNQASA